MQNYRWISILFLGLFLPLACYPQSRLYSGLVKGEDLDEPLIGVNILNLDDNTGTLSDLNGQFEIEALPGQRIQLSYIGYTTLLIELSEDTNLNLILQTDAEVLDEVVVIGYGTIKKSDLTGSVSKVKAEEIIKVPSANPLQSLQGKVAGLSITSTSGDPGANPVVRLRGVTTLNDNNPIAVIDGVITDVSAISLLNANDIESVEVLKDASASAIYGSRGAAGVIIVTTKRGVEGRNQVQFSIEQSIESAANKIEVMNGREFATYLNLIEPGTFNNLDALPDVNWLDLLLKNNAPMTNANFSIGGASDKSNFYFGLGYFRQDGILPKSALERLTTKINSEYKVSNNIDLGLNLSVLLSDKLNAPGVINTALRAWPINVPYLDDGITFAEVNGGNPLAAVAFTNSNTGALRGLGNLYTNINLLKFFRFKSSIQFDLTESKSRSFSPVYFVGPLQQNEDNDLSYNTSNNSSLIWENTLNYSQSLNKHSINALVGYTAQDIRSEFLTGRTEGLLREDPLFWYLDAGLDEFERVSNNFSRSTLLSYLGRVNYTYDSRYLFTASLRRDGSSKFGPNNKYGNFPSLAVGWNISNESFFEDIDLINRLKLRASWGIIGNERINGNAQYALITPGVNGVFGINENIQAGATFSGGGNPDLKWEETRQSNIGIDMGVWEDKVILEVDYYRKNTKDILVALEPIGYTGIGSFRSIFFNAANVVNEGFEWNLSYRENLGPINLQVSFLGTTINNLVTDIGQGLGADSLLVGGDLGNGQQVSRTAVGFPIGFFYGYEVEGVFQNQSEIENSATLFGQGPGDLRYKDLNGDGKIDGNDRTIIGSSIPDFIFGFSLNLAYKNVSLSTDFQGQTGNEIYNGKQAIRFTTLNYEDKYNNYWTGEGSTNTDPRPSLGGPNFQPSSYFIEDGSFLRLRTLTLNYDLPSKFIQKVKMLGGSVYLRASNLFTMTSYSGFSPEIGASSAIDGAIDRGVYPITRIFSLGININF